MPYTSEQLKGMREETFADLLAELRALPRSGTTKWKRASGSLLNDTEGSSTNLLWWNGRGHR